MTDTHRPPRQSPIRVFFEGGSPAESPTFATFVETYLDGDALFTLTDGRYLRGTVLGMDRGPMLTFSAKDPVLVDRETVDELRRAWQASARRT